jgi:NAD(P)-dependent dehydrogenase (short-subunit alcohol dehydrogenase family)
MLLADKVAIVTGGARGIGRGIALKFADEGCSVAVVDILADRAKETATEIAAKGKNALDVKCDHTDSGQVKEMVEKVIAKFGKIDILVNCAGAGGGRGGDPEEMWRKSIDINLNGPFLCSNYVVPHMKERKSGSIIYFSSYSAVIPTPAPAGYAAGKAGVLGLMYSSALQLAPFHIRVNAIVPEMVGTEFFGPPSAEREALFEKRGTYQLIGRVATPEDLAGVALFLASDLASYVTGTQILVGGKYPLGTVIPGGPPTEGAARK